MSTFMYNTSFFLVDVCKRKWKTLRDGYKKEKNREKERCRSGAGLGSGRLWRYAAVMSFLAPFLEFRETSGNFPSEPEPPASQPETPARAPSKPTRAPSHPRWARHPG